MLTVEKYRFGFIRVGGVEYRRDIVIFPDRVSPDWWRSEGHRLSPADLTEVIKYRPEVLVVGTGAYGAMDVPAGLVAELESAGTEVIALGTDAAVRRFNELLQAGRRVVGAFHLTC